MAETEHSQINISYIRTHVDNIEQLSKFAISSNPTCKEFIKKHLEQRALSPEVYLSLADGPRTLDEIMKSIHSSKSKGTISLVCKHLFEQGLLTKVPDPENAKSFKYTWGELEVMLGVSKIANEISRTKKKK